MPRLKPAINSFTSGEVSPRLEGRIDLDQYAQSCRVLENALVLPHGGVARRSGSRFVAEAEDSSVPVRLIPFVAAADASYIIEAGDEIFRFFRNEGPVGAPFTITTPYQAEELKDLQWAQSADVLFLVHPNHPLFKLSRTSTTTFTLAEVEFAGSRWPFQLQNTTPTTLTVVGGGPFTLTFSTDIGLTSAKDVGRIVVFDDAINALAASTGDCYEITSVISGSVCVADRIRNTSASSVGPAITWALGMTSDTEGFNAVVLHEGRLWLGGSASAPNRLSGSRSDDFENHAVGTGLADQAIVRSIVGSQVPNIQWMATSGERLHIGGLGMEFFLKGENNDILTPSGTAVVPSTSVGSDHIQPVLIGGTVVFAQRAARKLRELNFSVRSATDSGFDAADLSILAEHILRTPSGGVTEMFYQQDPDSVIWCVRADGELVGITREIQQSVIGGHRQIIGGVFQGGKAVIESAAVIPAPDGSHDQVWVAVKRTIDGVTKRYIEFFEDPFDPEVVATADDLELIQAVEEGFFVDSGLTFDNPISITDITTANPPVVTATAHGLSNGDRIRIREVVGMTDVNHTTYLISNVTANTFELQTVDSVDVDGLAFSAYITGGTAREEVTVVSGLSHLEGETVQILADGSPETPIVVAGGSITLDNPASIIHIGLGYNTNIETQRPVTSSKLGPGIGEIAKLRSVSLRLYESLGVLVGQGPTGANLERPIFRDGDDPMDRALPLFSGDVFVPIESRHDTEPTVYIRQDQPLPLTVLAVTMDIETGER